ncbi:hypothetical protein SCH01S_14_00140 [Sphingomonas changbaiensis NBRC 104936]|uniref:Uncharacterized protein n=1 Tax=Sphingomonas changbaiensis NBRC 104936 TaxID=1219043 RepID=A0A0E9MMI8_9SPHN|nr:hypothetical protein [Sphingomonas changbaiensis]GAO38350.1 hypothetical protein SCH01S_14_00140 [Sphingomonas changbaiensis NBRC 104936]
MGPKKGTKAYEREIVEFVYGIDQVTKQVRSVSVQRDRMLSTLNANGDYVRHYAGGRSAKSEAALVFGLTDTYTVPAGLADAEWAKAEIKKLEEKAAKMREEDESA